MKTLLLIKFLIFSSFSFGQRPTTISGRIVDENNRPVSNVMIHFGGDTSFSDQQGHFKVNYPNPQQFKYYFYFEANGYFPKSVSVDLSDKEIVLKESIIIRSRKTFWYDTNQIDSTHLGLTVDQIIKKYKLDIDMCLLWDEPPGVYHHFTTEMGDSSEICIVFQGIFTTKKRLKMNDILDRKIKGIGISYTDGNEKSIGEGCIHKNSYFIERTMRKPK